MELPTVCPAIDFIPLLTTVALLGLLLLAPLLAVGEAILLYDSIITDGLSLYDFLPGVVGEALVLEEGYMYSSSS